MSAKTIYIILAAIAALIAALVILGKSNNPANHAAPLPPGMTQEQADKYRNAARRTNFEPSKPGRYEWTDPTKVADASDDVPEPRHTGARAVPLHHFEKSKPGKYEWTVPPGATTTGK